MRIGPGRVARRAALGLAALLGAPAVGRAQMPGQAGCGTYFCFTVEEGYLHETSGGTPYEGPYLQVTRALLTPAFATLGTTHYAWSYDFYVGFTCRTPYGGCHPDGATAYLHGSDDRASDVLRIENVALTNGQEAPVLTPGREVAFTAFDAAGQPIATETFDAALVVLPEPATLALTAAGLGLAGALAWRRRA